MSHEAEDPDCSNFPTEAFRLLPSFLPPILRVPFGTGPESVPRKVRERYRGPALGEIGAGFYAVPPDLMLDDVETEGRWRAGLAHHVCTSTSLCPKRLALTGRGKVWRRRSG